MAARTLPPTGRTIETTSKTEVATFCPQYNAEYRVGFMRCSDCDVDLVDYLPVVPPPDATCMEHSNNPRGYEEDRLVAIEDGSNLFDPRNLWRNLSYGMAPAGSRKTSSKKFNYFNGNGTYTTVPGLIVFGKLRS